MELRLWVSLSGIFSIRMASSIRKNNQKYLRTPHILFIWNQV